jgi:hypothetical protein
MSKREQLEEKGQNNGNGSNSNNNNNNNGKRLRGDAAVVASLLAAAAQPPLQPRRPFMAFAGTRHTRVGDNYQVTQLPSPSSSTTTTTIHVENGSNPAATLVKHYDDVVKI